MNVWNVANGTKQFSWKVHSVVRSVLFLNDEQLATACGQRVVIWDVVEAIVLRSLENPYGIICMALWPSDDMLMTGEKGGEIKLWNLRRAEGEELVKTLKGHERDVRSVALSADGQSLWSGDVGGILKKWEVV